jgi:DNA-binding protein H-NS
MSTKPTVTELLKRRAELMAQNAEIDKQIAQLKKDAAGVIKRIKVAIQVYGITAEELGLKTKNQTRSHHKAEHNEAPKPHKTKPKRITRTATRPKPAAAAKKSTRPSQKGWKRPIKYADDKGNKWSGGGMTPRWLKAYIAEGRDQEEFRVQPAKAA